MTIRVSFTYDETSDILLERHRHGPAAIVEMAFR